MVFSNPSQSRESILITEWGKHSLSFSVFHEKDNRVLATRIVDLGTPLNDMAASDFERLFKEETVLAYSFEKLICLLDTSLMTLVPNSLFQMESSKDALQLVHDIPSGQFEFCNERLLSIDYQVVYALPKNLKDALSKHFMNVSYDLTAASLLNYFSKLNQLDALFAVHFNAEEILVYRFENKKLIFFNSFDFITAEDVIYLLLHVMNDQKLHPDRSLVYYSGLLPEDSSIMSELKEYIKNLKPLPRTNKVNYATDVASMPEHYFVHHYSKLL